MYNNETRFSSSGSALDPAPPIKPVKLNGIKTRKKLRFFNTSRLKRAILIQIVLLPQWQPVVTVGGRKCSPLFGQAQESAKQLKSRHSFCLKASQSFTPYLDINGFPTFSGLLCPYYITNMPDFGKIERVLRPIKHRSPRGKCSSVPGQGQCSQKAVVISMHSYN